MGRHCIAVPPSRFRAAYKFVHATAYSQVDDSIMAWFTADPDEALVIDGENEVRCLLHELQARYPLRDFAVWDIEEQSWKTM